MRRNILTTGLGILFTTFAASQGANATLISVGEIQVSGPVTGQGSFSFLIGDISVVGFFDEGTRLLLPGYEGTSFVGDHSLVGSTDMFYGYVDSTFVLWNKPGIGGSLIPTSLDTTAPGALLTQGQTVYHTPFAFEGALCGSFVVNTPCDVIFPSLTGHGIAEFTFNESVLDDGRHFFTPTKATYTFIPEPSSLALLCFGLLAIAFVKRRHPQL